MPDLQSLSVPLWIMAVVSVLQALVLIGAGVAGYMAYSRVMTLVNDLEARQIAPLREKTDAILADVKAITARVSQQTERVDHAITGTIDRVDDTATRVRAGVHDKVSQAVGVVRGVRAVIMSLLHRESPA
jgi:outer membrane murein-binding lipoprotein Lpp